MVTDDNCGLKELVRHLLCIYPIIVGKNSLYVPLAFIEEIKSRGYNPTVKELRQIIGQASIDNYLRISFYNPN